MNIKSFLTDPNRNFKTGIDLYNQVKTSKEYDDFFAKAGNPNPGDLAFNILEKQLNRALRKQLDHNIDFSSSNDITPTPGDPIQVKKIVHQKIKPAITVGENRIIDIPGLTNAENLPEEIKAAYFENKKIMVEMAGARQRMAAINQDHERKPVAEEIANLHKRKEQNWHLINSYLKGKSIPIPELAKREIADGMSLDLPSPDPVSEALSISKRIRTIKINIGRAQKEIHSGKLKGSKLKTRLASLEGWEKELTELESKLPG